jgi:type I restriction enzyme S subunit
VEVRPGYKQTEVGVIPEDWRVKSFGELFSYRNGVNAEKESYGQGVRFINVLEPITYSHIYGPEITGQVTLPESVAASYAVRRGDVLFNRTSETQEEVGLAATYLGSERVVFGGFVIRGRPTDGNLDPTYCGYALRAPSIRLQIIPMGQGAIRSNIGQSNLSLVLAPVPPLPEQRAIATALSDVDALLGALDRLIAKKRDLKLAAMQQLLTGQTRLPGFHGEWEVKRLDSVADVLKGKALSKSLTTASGTRLCILYGELFTTYGRVISEVVGRTNSSEGCPSMWGDVLMPGSTTTTGADLAAASALIMDDVALGGDIIIIRRNGRGYDPVFMANYLTHARRYEIAELTQGITIHHLYGKDLKSLSLQLPPLPEQAAIAAVLSDMDAELAALEQRLVKTRALKQGMMQELLTGRTRLM